MHMNIVLTSNVYKGEIPKRATKGSAGLDLRAAETCVIIPGGVSKVDLGIRIAKANEGPRPIEVATFLMSRSGFAKYGIGLMNGVGLIDEDYTGPVMGMFYNAGDTPFTIDKGDRCAQIVFVSILTPRIEIVECLDVTERNSGGFGHSGV